VPIARWPGQCSLHKRGSSLCPKYRSSTGIQPLCFFNFFERFRKAGHVQQKGCVPVMGTLRAGNVPVPIEIHEGERAVRAWERIIKGDGSPGCSGRSRISFVRRHQRVFAEQIVTVSHTHIVLGEEHVEEPAHRGADDCVRKQGSGHVGPAAASAPPAARATAGAAPGFDSFSMRQ